MKNWLIKLLGGYTEEDIAEIIDTGCMIAIEISRFNGIDETIEKEERIIN